MANPTPRTSALIPCLLAALAISTGSLVAAEGGVRPRERLAAADTLSTSKGPLQIIPIHHATVVFRWAGGETTVFVDPVGGSERFAGMGSPDVVLVTDIHGDHLDPGTIAAVARKARAIVGPQAVIEKLRAAEGIPTVALTTLAPGATTEPVEGLSVEAVLAYNRTEGRERFHPRGRGVGYVVGFGDRRVYLSGDTEDTEEMRALEKIDVAFLCMNLPYTMTASAAASAVAAFKPSVVYPYHFRGRGEGGTQDPAQFQALVARDAPGVEVRIRDWYPGEDIGLGPMNHPALRDPKLATEKAPDEFQVVFRTTKGTFTVEVRRKWAPRGADRFYNLARIGFYDGASFFRVIGGFMAQFGIHGDPEVQERWRDAKIPDDPVVESNTRGRISFAMAGPNTRTTQLFINYGDNSRLDGMRFAPFGEVVRGMDVVDKLHSGYGEGAPAGRGPSQGRIQREGNAYLEREFPKLDRIRTARIVPKR